MALSVASSTPPLRERICAWVDEAMDKGADPDLAYLSAFERMREAGLTESFLDTFGTELVCLVYKRRTQANWGAEDRSDASRSAAPERPLTSPYQHGRATGSPYRGPRPTETPPSGHRRVDVSQLQGERALLSALVQVDGRWLTMAQLTMKDCLLLSGEQAELSRKHGKTADFFMELLDRLVDGSTVGQVYTENELRRLLESL